MALDIHAHRAEQVVLGEPLAVDVDHQNLDSVPAPFPQLLELFGTGFDGLPADGALGHSHGGRHLRQDLLILACGNAAQERTQHVLAESTVLT